MALRDRRKELVEYINLHRPYTEHNIEALDIFNGNLDSRIDAILRDSLSKNYYDKIRHRRLPINVLPRLISKLAKVYATAPLRRAIADNDTLKAKNQQFIEDYEGFYKLNQMMNVADEYANLFKGYALQPHLIGPEGKKEPRLRTLPFDRFLVKGPELSLDGGKDPLQPEVFILFLGRMPVTVSKNGKTGTEMREVFFSYTDDEFDAFDIEAEEFSPALEKNKGENPFKTIPFMYGSRSLTSLLPPQDTDILQLTKVLPVMLSDAAGAQMFQCFAIMYGIDIKSQKLVITPNGFWTFKSDPKAGLKPQIGQLTPKADTGKILDFVKTVFAFWLETKGIKVGNVGDMDGGSSATGISKIIDNMDTAEQQRVNQLWFREEEVGPNGLWNLTVTMNNVWVEQRKLPKFKTIDPATFAMAIEFDDPMPRVDRGAQVDTAAAEVDNGFATREQMIKRLNPNMEQTEVDEILTASTRVIKIPAPKEGTQNGKEDDKEDSTEDGSEDGTEGRDSVSA